MTLPFPPIIPFASIVLLVVYTILELKEDKGSILPEKVTYMSFVGGFLLFVHGFCGTFESLFDTLAFWFGPAISGIGFMSMTSHDSEVNPE